MKEELRTPRRGSPSLKFFISLLSGTWVCAVESPAVARRYAGWKLQVTESLKRKTRHGAGLFIISGLCLHSVDTLVGHDAWNMEIMVTD